MFFDEPCGQLNSVLKAGETETATKRIAILLFLHFPISIYKFSGFFCFSFSHTAHQRNAVVKKRLYKYLP